MHAAVGQCRRHIREIATRDTDRTLPEIILEYRHGIVDDDAEVLEHPRDGTIAKPGLALRPINCLVDGYGVSEKRGHDLGDARPLLRRACARDQPRYRDCTSIDHGVQWCTGLGIE